MSSAYVSIYVNNYEEENKVRTFGGCRSSVRSVAKQYKKMSKEEFLAKHPNFADKCKDNFKLIVDATCPVY